MSTTLRASAVGFLALALGLAGCATTGDGSQDPTSVARRVSSHLTLGADHLQAGRRALALREFLAAEHLAPRNAEVQYALGEAYLAQQKPNDAEKHFKRAIELRPGYHDAQLSLSALYIVQARYQETIDVCQHLIDDPTFPAPWRALANRGWAQYRLGRAVEARRSLEKARELDDKYWPAMLSLAVIDADQGRRLDAIGLLEEVIELKPGPRAEAEANYRLAENYIALGQRQKAVGHLTTAVARAPDGEWARRSQKYLKLLR